MTPANTADLLSLVKQYGGGLVLGALIIWMLWAQNEGYRSLREGDIKDLKNQIVAEREYIRTTLQDVIERNTDAYKELKTELQRTHYER